ncbi:MAG: adenosylcobinamide-GDP ribazoletransferase [Thermodesulfovibrionales bacterium]|nr:adenosylcobinamide-GDP ribazoletransferase [Thermodesulfovibrionales bacterium]
MIALQFLTIIPIDVKTTYTERDIAKSSSAFIFVGLLQGLMLILISLALSLIFNEELVIALMLLFLVLLNGGFHLDGLSDTFDALSVKSSGDIEKDMHKRLAIMKDSTAGPIGITSIIFILALKYLCLKAITNMSYFILYSTFLFMPVVSKWTMVTAMFYGKSAKKEGLGRIFIEGVKEKEFIFSTIIFIILLLTVHVGFITFAPKWQYIFNMLLLVTLYLFSRLWIMLCDKKFGGLTGDTLGALSEITETIFLLLVIVWSRLYIL